MKKHWFAMLVLGVPALAGAEELSVSKAATLPLEVSGFLDVGISADATRRSSDYALSEIELDLKKSFAGVASFRADLNFRWADAHGPDGKLVAPDYDRLFEQAFVTVDLLKKSTGLSFTFGKFNAPIGFEGLDPPDRYQLTLSNMFSYLLPFNLLGALVSWERGPVTVLAHVTKGWDLFDDNNQSMTFGGRVALSLAGGQHVLGLSALWGPEGGRDGLARTVVDVDATLKLTDKVLLGLEANYGTQVLESGRRAHWYGFLSTVHVRWREWLGTTLRYDYISDGDGVMLPGGVGQKRQSLTAAALFPLSRGTAPFTVATGALAGIEYRTDFADARVFATDGAGAASPVRHQISARLAYAW